MEFDDDSLLLPSARDFSPILRGHLGHQTQEQQRSGFAFMNPMPLRNQPQVRERQGGRPTAGLSFCIAVPSPPGRQNDENEETAVLTLMHFQAVPFLNFKDVKIGNVKTLPMIVRNPLPDMKQSCAIVKSPKVESGFLFDNSQFVVEEERDYLYGITWKPNKVGKVRETIHFQTSCGHRVHAVLIGNCLAPPLAKPRGKPRWGPNSSKKISPVKTVTSVKRPFQQLQLRRNSNVRRRSSGESKVTKKITISNETIVKAKKSPEVNETYTVNVPEIVVDFGKTRSTAALAIQQAWRCYKAKQILIEKKAKVIELERENNAARIIQRTFRSYVLMKQLQQQFLEHLRSQERVEAIRTNAAVFIQTVWRGYKAKKVLSERKAKAVTLKRENNAAQVIQRYFRSYVLMKQLRQQFVEHLRIQMYAKVTRTNAALLIQTVWRGYRAKKILSEKKAKAVTLKRENAAQIIQSYYRSYVLTKRLRHEFLEHLRIQMYAKVTRANAALLIQKVWRCYKAKQILMEMKAKAETLKRENNAVQVIQRYFRSYILTKQLRQQFVEHLLIQKQIKITRRNAAVFIQTAWRGYKAKQILMEKKAKAIKLERENNAAQIIQLYFRSYVSMKQLRQQFLEHLRSQKHVEVIRTNAAVLIQTVWRGYKAKQILSEMKAKAVTLKRESNAAQIIQSYFRSYVLAKRLRNEFLEHLRNQKIAEVTRTNSVVLIQTIWRGYRAKKLLLVKKAKAIKLERENNAAQVIQSYFRSYVLTKRLRHEFLEHLRIQIYAKVTRTNAAILIQCVWRGYRAKKILLEKKAKAIKWKRENNAAQVIQRYFRSYILTNRLRSEFLEHLRNQKHVAVIRTNAVVLIQSLWRGYIMRKYVIKLNKAAVVIQAHWRVYNTRKLRLEEKTKAIELEKRNNAAKRIQQCYIAYVLMKKQRKEFVEMKRAASVIKLSYKSFAMRKKWKSISDLLQRRKNSKLAWLNAVILIQRVWRGYVVRKSIARLERAATIIQSTWRGYQTRKIQFEQNDSIHIAFQRIAETNASAKPDMQLGRRTSSALNVLLTYKSLKYLSNELKSLEVTTRLSADSCVMMANVDVIDVLTKILNQSNRSEPHKFIINYAISILINLAKYDKTLPYVANNDEVLRTTVKFAKIHIRDQEIFRKCCTLLWILLTSDKKILKAMMKNDTVICQLRKMLEIVRNEYVRFNNNNNVSNGNGFNKKRKSSKMIEIKFDSGWYVAKTAKYEFDDRLVAIQSLAILLQIE